MIVGSKMRELDRGGGGGGAHKLSSQNTPYKLGLINVHFISVYEHCAKYCGNQLKFRERQ